MRKEKALSETKTFQTSLAVIADIHGNRLALEAALQDIDRRSIQQIVNLGDHLTGPFDPAGTADMLFARKWGQILHFETLDSSARNCSR